MVERLVYADSPRRDDASDGQQAMDVTIKTDGLSKNNIEEIVDPLPCAGLELEKASLSAVTTTSFATVSAGSKLVKGGRDATHWTTLSDK
jgi:hypothetical protein